MVLTEQSQCSPLGPIQAPFRVTIDGVAQPGEVVNEADSRRCADVALDGADIQIKYDDLAASPSLNTWTDRSLVPYGQAVHFYSYSNYVHWISKAEVRLFARQTGAVGTPLWTVPLAIGGNTEWAPPADAPGELVYVLRVYDRAGHFDETVAKTLSLTGADFKAADNPAKPLAGWGEKRAPTGGYTGEWRYDFGQRYAHQARSIGQRAGRAGTGGQERAFCGAADCAIRPAIG